MVIKISLMWDIFGTIFALIGLFWLALIDMYFGLSLLIMGGICVIISYLADIRKRQMRTENAKR